MSVRSTPSPSKSSSRTIISPSSTPRRLRAFGFTQFGFGSPEEKLDDVIAEHQFLYRVHHDRSFTEFHPGTGFTAGLYRKQSLASALNDYKARSSDRNQFEADVSAEVRGIPEPSPFISVSLSLPFALRWAERLDAKGYRGAMITVIDACSVSDDAFIALDICSSAIRHGHTEGCKFYYDYANSFQEVLIPVNIPPRAIFASVSWQDMERSGHLPRWFLSPDGDALSRRQYDSHRIRNFFADVRGRFDEVICEESAMLDASSFAIFLLNSWLSQYEVQLDEDTYMDSVLPAVALLAYEIVKWPSLLFEGSHAVPCKAELWNMESVKSALTSIVYKELRLRWRIQRKSILKRRLKEIRDEEASIEEELSEIR